MPKIVINEIDKTTAGNLPYRNFTVVIPGPTGNKTNMAVFDENGIYECNSQKEFVENIGKINAAQVPVANQVTPATNPSLKDVVKSTAPVFTVMGNRIAYELLGLGYTILYKRYSDITELTQPEFWECLKDRSVYDFRYICLGGYDKFEAIKNIIDIAVWKNTKVLGSTVDPVGRGDCFALVDFDESGLTAADKKQSEYVKRVIADVNVGNRSFSVLAAGDAGKYFAIFAPRVTYRMPADGDDIYTGSTFPASFHYLACAAKAFDNSNEWWAVSGYNRGYSDYLVESTTSKLGEIAVNQLQPRTYKEPAAEGAANGIKLSVNIIRSTRDGYYIWGNRTAQLLTADGLVASHFLNIRQLCCTLKKELNRSCMRVAYDPNSDLLWEKFCNMIRPELEAMKADEGIKDYKLVKVVNKAKALLTAKIRIVPVEAVEDFELEVSLEDSLNGVTVSEE